MEDLDEEKYLAVELPVNWQTLDLRNTKDTSRLSTDELRAVRIAQREDHPYKEAGIALLENMENIQKYTTLISSV